MELDDAVPGDDWWPDFESPIFESDAEATEGEFPCSDVAGDEARNEMHYLMQLEERLAGVHDCGPAWSIANVVSDGVIFVMQASLDTSRYTYL